MDCPRDGLRLFPQAYEDDVFVDACPKCKGIFLSRGELQKIEAAHEHDYSEMMSRMPDLVARAYERARQRAEGELNCPKCGSEMETREYAYCSQVMINKCVKCGGIWLDRGEVEALEIFYEREREGARRSFLGSLLRH
jgi:Zn-finger nucleic acid-binding protein